MDLVPEWAILLLFFILAEGALIGALAPWGKGDQVQTLFTFEDLDSTSDKVLVIRISVSLMVAASFIYFFILFGFKRSWKNSAFGRFLRLIMSAIASAGGFIAAGIFINNDEELIGGTVDSTGFEIDYIGYIMTWIVASAYAITFFYELYSFITSYCADDSYSKTDSF